MFFLNELGTQHPDEERHADIQAVARLFGEVLGRRIGVNARVYLFDARERVKDDRVRFIWRTRAVVNEKCFATVRAACIPSRSFANRSCLHAGLVEDVAGSQGAERSSVIW